MSRYFKNCHLLLVVAISFFSSCNSPRYIYAASPPNNPNFSEKGQSKLAAYYSSVLGHSSTEKLAAGLDLHGAFAISDHWAVISSYYQRTEKDVFTEVDFNDPFKNSVVKYKRNSVELGAGYYTAVNAGKSIFINLYAGAATGKLAIDDNGTDQNNMNYTRYYSNHASKFFFQSAVNFIPSPNFNLSFIVKSTYVQYRNIHTSYTIDELQTLRLDEINNKTFNFIEPAVNFEIGLTKYPGIKLSALLSWVANHPFYDNNIRYSNSSIGLTLDFSKLGKWSK
ncbi:MAG: hypothetical protein ABIY51_04755 [Ferruginibacter sp.]